MKTEEQLLSQPLGFKFDTPKKLNRSEKKIPANIIEDLEDGKFTCEAIEKLSLQFPVFRYQTCITIHGSWGVVNTGRVGGYQNVHRNKNGSVEIRYSAIDHEKIKRIRENIRKISPFRFHESSSDRYFYIQRLITNETRLSDVNELKAIAERLQKCNIYGRVSLFRAATMFQQFLCLHVSPLAIPEAEVLPFSLQLCGLNQSQWETKIEERAREDQKDKEAETKRNNDSEAELKKKRQELSLQLAKLRPLIAHLPLCKELDNGVLVSIDEFNPSFVYHRLDGKGSFGRVNWSRARTNIFTTDLTLLDWKAQKQQLLNTIRLKECRLLTGAKLR